MTAHWARTSCASISPRRRDDGLGPAGPGPAAAEPAFERGRYTQHLELPGRWLERGRIAADDQALLHSPLGLAGHSVMGSLWFAAGQALPGARREALLESAREISGRHALAATSGSTAPEPCIVVLRVLGARVEPVMGLLTEVWAAWRQLAWQLAPCAPRVWRT